MRFVVLLLLVAAVQAAPRLNVLLITADDMSQDSVGVFGCPVKATTPHIDRLASEGMRFRHAHVTIAICRPTRAVWMTGRYPQNNGALGFDPIRKDVPTLVESLAAAGYLNGIFAKQKHVVPTRAAAFHVSVLSKDLRFGRDPAAYHRHAAAFFARAKNESKPFFLMANVVDPHRPFAGSRRETARRKKGQDFPEAKNPFDPEDVVVPGFLPDLPPIRKEIAQYYTSVRRADASVGAVLRALDESGLAKRTLVFFLSDHGMPLPFSKTNCYLHSTRTPWIVRWPKVVKRGAVDTTHLVSGIDLAPTILDALGLAALPGVDGRSFVPVLKGGTQEGRTEVFTQINTTSAKRSYRMRAVQDARYGYIFNAWSNGKMRFRNESQAGLTFRAMVAAAPDSKEIAARVHHFLFRTPEELYDYETDPNALRNLATDPRHRATLLRLRAALRAYLAATHDPLRKRLP